MANYRKTQGYYRLNFVCFCERKLSSAMVEDVLHCEQDQRDDGESELQVFRALLSGVKRHFAPLRGGAISEAADLPECEEIDDGSQ